MRKFLKISKWMSLFAICILVSSCDRELDSENITVGEIRFPSIIMKGDNPISYVVGTATEVTDPGVTALLGTDDISSQVEVTGIDAIDFDTPGIYPINYRVATVNDLGSESEVNEQRYVVITKEDVSAYDVSGEYFSLSKSFSGASYGQLMTVRKLANGYFSCTDVYAHPSADNAGRFFLISSTEAVYQPQGTTETIFGLDMDGTVDVNMGNSDPEQPNLVFKLNLPAANFSTSKAWTKNENFN